MRGEKGGFLLVELLVALALLAVAVPTLLAVFDTGVQALTFAEAQTLGVNLAREHLEQVRTLGYCAAVSSAEESVPGFERFTRRVDVTEPDETEEQLKEVKVIVEWQGRAGRHDTSLTTIISRR